LYNRRDRFVDSIGPSPIGLTALFALWFDPDSVVDRGPNALLAAKISLRGLDRNVAQQELYLFQFASRCVTQSRARPTIMPHAA